MSDERAERMRNKRNAAKDKATETAETDEQDKPSEPSEQGESDKTDESDETEDSESVKDEHVGVYMYVPEEQKDEVSYQFDRLKAEYKRETGDELEKNRHFYPLLITHGLDSLEDWDGSDVRERIED